MDDEKKALGRLKELGYRIRKPGPYVKFSTLVHEGTLTEFRAAASQLDYKIQEAVTEAFDLWLESKKRD